MPSSIRQRSLRSNRKDARSPVPAMTIPSAIEVTPRLISSVGLSGRKAIMHSFEIESNVVGGSFASLRALKCTKKCRRVATAMVQPVPAYLNPSACENSVVTRNQTMDNAGFTKQPPATMLACAWRMLSQSISFGLEARRVEQYLS